MNLPDLPRMPVKVFRSQRYSLETQIGGLLDYGYSTAQVIQMLGLPADSVRSIMKREGFTELSGPWKPRARKRTPKALALPQKGK